MASPTTFHWNTRKKTGEDIQQQCAKTHQANQAPQASKTTQIKCKCKEFKKPQRQHKNIASTISVSQFLVSLVHYGWRDIKWRRCQVRIYSCRLTSSLEHLILRSTVPLTIVCTTNYALTLQRTTPILLFWNACHICSSVIVSSKRKFLNPMNPHGHELCIPRKHSL